MSFFRKQNLPPVPKKKDPSILPHAPYETIYIPLFSKDQEIFSGPNLEVYAVGKVFKPAVERYRELVQKIMDPYHPDIRQIFCVTFDDIKDGQQKVQIMQHKHYLNPDDRNFPSHLFTIEYLNTKLDRKSKKITFNLAKRNSALTINGFCTRVSDKQFWNGCRDTRTLALAWDQIPFQVKIIHQMAEQELDRMMVRWKNRGSGTAHYHVTELSSNRKAMEGETRKKSFSIYFENILGFSENKHYYLIYQKQNGIWMPVGLETRD